MTAASVGPPPPAAHFDAAAEAPRPLVRGRPALAAEERRTAPASFGQASLWFLRQVMPYPSAYNTAVELRLDGALDAGAAEAAWREIVRRHESFRTTFTVTEGTVLQVISAEMPADVTTTDLAASADPEGDALGIARAAASAPFDLDRGPLLRVRLLRLGRDRHALVVVMDHIVADGMSLGILWRELSALYRAFRAGEPSPLAPPPKQYAACVEAQNEWLKTPAFARQLKYWTEHLAGAAACDLPADRPRPPVRSFRGDLAVIELPAALTGRLRAVAERDEVSLFAALLAGLDVLLARYSGQDDVVVMIPIACRQRFAAEEVVGFFANMVVLRTQVAGRQSYRELVRRVNKEIMAGVFRQDVPFEKVIEALRPDRSLSHDPLARIALSFLPAHAATLELPGVVTTYGEIPNGGSKFDLHFVIVEHEGHLSCSAEYNSDVFDAETIRDLLEHYRLLLTSASASPEDATADLRLLAPAEQHRIVTEWNETRAEYLRGATLPELFAAAAARSPEAPALWFEGESETFRGLDHRSNQVARALRARGAGPGTLVGIAVERSIAMVVGLLGILKSGAAYVPLDPAYPRDRLALMAEDSSLRLLVTEDRFADLVPAPANAGAWMLRLDGDAAEIASQHDGPLESAIHPEAIAYVIYTSGSTGRPKGVQIPHRAVVNFLTTMARLPGLAATDRLLAVTSLSFDIAGLELWLPLTRGAQVEVASRETAGNGAALRRILETGRTTVLQATPSTFRLLLEAGWERTPGLKVLVGGEATPRELADKLAERADSVWNMYGPTETTIWSCVHPLENGAPVLIGRPVANTSVYVLDRDLSPVPASVPGELYIGGDGVAHGYLGRPGLTAERFIPDGCSGRPGGRLYRTGDLCRWSRDGAIEFLGRLDFQLKLRGYRIELGEIEAVLAEHRSVQRAVVVAREDGPEGKRLVAYVVLVAGPAASTDGLRAHLAAKLPEHMIPSALVVLDAIPVLPNGKIDRRALPAPREASRDEGAFVGPRTPAEELVAGIWADVLGQGRVSVVDDFFALGGHSLLGMRVLARLGAALRIELPLRTLFEARTVAQLAARADAERHRGELAVAPPLRPVARTDALPLSFAQQRLWFLDQLEPNGAPYNLPVAMRLDGALDAGALLRSLREIERRHEALRTTFVAVRGEPRQIIAAEPSLAMQVIDLSSLPPAERESQAHALASGEAQRRFDLARGPLFRATLYRLGESDHLLVVVMHHIVSDGWSEGVLGRDLSAIYAAFSAGLPSPLAELPIQAADHALWQRAWLTGPTLDKQIAYWKDRLRGAPSALDLPTDRPRPAMQSTVGTTHPVTLSRELTGALTALSRRHGVTLFMTLLASFQVLLHRYSGQDDIVVGSPTAGRLRAETEPLIGFFVNTVALRADLRCDPSLRELLAQAREATLDAYAHQEAPFEKLVEALAPPRDLSRSPLFQAMLILQNAPPAPTSLGAVTLRRVDVERGTSKFDLTLVLEETGEGMAGFLEYPLVLFDAATIARMAGHLRMLLEAAAADPDRRASEMPLLTAGERHTILETWNDTARPYPRDACLHDLVEAQAAARPGAVALLQAGQTLTYGALNDRADRLAEHLGSLGARPGVLVGLAMERSFDMVVGLLGILKTGAAYVPLDPTYPSERLAFMIGDSGMPLLVTQARIVAGLPEHRARVVLLDANGEVLRGAPGGEEPSPAPRATSADRAYVIYTSGSTGKPKGVQVPHHAVVNFLASMAARPGLGPSDRLLAVTSLSFDIAGLELWLPLSVGAQVEIASREAAGDGAALRRLLETGGITVMQATPTTFRILLEAGWAGSPGLAVLVGGEAVPRDLADRLLDRAGSVWNMYGPTETTIWSSLQRLEKNAPVLIGLPIANTEIYVLDRHLAPVPAGIAGELFIGGAGVADGYLGRPELTRERFVPDPFSGGSTRLYRTGDLCRRRAADGAIEFLGRADFQVKLRGHRIELGEIETTLVQHPAIREAVVVASEAVSGEPRLVAYVTTAPGAAPSGADLRVHLRATLPEYMVPAHFMVLERLPLTANNKIDRKSLPPPELAPSGAAGAATPRGARELKLLAIWEELLGVTGIGVRDSFFDVGGHSLMALKLFDRIERAFGVRLPIASLFQAQTVAELADLLRREGWEPSWSSLVPIQTGGTKPPFFCVHAVGGNVLNYRLLSRHLGTDQPFYGLQARGLGGNEAPHTTIEEMAAAYIAEIRQEQPRGPYALGGASAGGVVAFEMAQQLLAAGDRVSALVLLDTYRAGPPHPRVIEARTASPIHRPGMLLDYHLGMLLLRTPREGVSYLAERVRARFGGTSGPVAQAIQAAMPAVRHVIETNMRALQSYVPSPYPGTAVMLLSRDEPDRAFCDGRLAWADLFEEGLVLRFIPGSHQNMLEEPQVAGVADVIARCLA